jgi:glycosyltransferase involved in cell wall biosynthesis
MQQPLRFEVSERPSGFVAELGEDALSMRAEALAQHALQPHILHVLDAVDEPVAARIAELLRALHALKVRQTLLHEGKDIPAGSALAQLPEGIRTQSIRAAGKVTPSRLSRAQLAAALDDAIEDDAPVVVHLHAYRAGFAGRFAMRRLARGGARCMYSPHGLVFLDRRQWLSSRLAFWSEWFASRAVEFLPVAAGTGEADVLEQLSRRSAYVLEPSVDSAVFELVRAPQARPIVISTGLAGARSGAEQFADMCVQAHIQELDAEFVWVGGFESGMDTVLRGAGVRVTGELTEHEIHDYLRRCTAFVQASSWEGDAAGVARAMAAAAPCVVSDVLGNRDAVTHARTGLIGADATALLRNVMTYIENPQLATALGAAARADAWQRFSPERFRENLIALYGLQTAA